MRRNTVCLMGPCLLDPLDPLAHRRPHPDRIRTGTAAMVGPATASTPANGALRPDTSAPNTKSSALGHGLMSIAGAPRISDEIVTASLLASPNLAQT